MADPTNVSDPEAGAPSDTTQPQPIGHRLQLGRHYAHVMRVYDGGVVTGRLRNGRTVSFSTLLEHAICGRARGGPLRARDVAGTAEGAARIHGDRLARESTGRPALRAPDGYEPCRACFGKYEPSE